MTLPVPQEPRPRPLRHFQHVQGEGILLDGEVGDVDDGRSVLLEEADGGELVGLELPRWGDDERGGGVDVGYEEGDGEGDRGADEEDGVEGRSEGVALGREGEGAPVGIGGVPPSRSWAEEGDDEGGLVEGEDGIGGLGEVAARARKGREGSSYEGGAEQRIGSSCRCHFFSYQLLRDTWLPGEDLTLRFSPFYFFLPLLLFVKELRPEYPFIVKKGQKKKTIIDQ